MARGEHGGVTVLLVHGGLWEPVGAERFWHRPGVVAGLRERGLRVLAPDRPARAAAWGIEADRLAAHLGAGPAESFTELGWYGGGVPPGWYGGVRPTGGTGAGPGGDIGGAPAGYDGGSGGPVAVVAGSNGCSAAVRLALAYPGLVGRLVLAWPATAGDPAVDGPTGERLAGQGAPAAVVAALLAGGALRGVTDVELAGLRLPVGVLPAVPDNPVHQRRTVDALLAALPAARELPGCPEAPRPDFPPHLPAFLHTVAGFVAGPA